MSKKFNDIYQNSLKNPENFWQEVSNDIFWFKKPTKILNNLTHPFINGLKMVLPTLVTML